MAVVGRVVGCVLMERRQFDGALALHRRRLGSERRALVRLTRANPATVGDGLLGAAAAGASLVAIEMAVRRRREFISAVNVARCLVSE